ncbi:MAG: hypothetical protein ACLU4N_26180 [Butyricimonas faecihominis]
MITKLRFFGAVLGYIPVLDFTLFDAACSSLYFVEAQGKMMV